MAVGKGGWEGMISCGQVVFRISYELMTDNRGMTNGAGYLSYKDAALWEVVHVAFLVMAMPTMSSVIRYRATRTKKCHRSEVYQEGLTKGQEGVTMG